MSEDRTPFRQSIEHTNLMDSSETERRDAEFDDLQARRMRFYAQIGQCVTTYQSVEDYLPELFAAALGGGDKKALAIFAVVRSLEAKLDIITAALVDRDEQYRKRWAELIRRIGAAASARNQIAHATPVNNAGTFGPIQISFDSEKPTERRIAPRIAAPRMELHKRTRGGETVWTTDLMSLEYRQTKKLLRHLIALAMELRGETPPEHLLEE
jgi:hypothetical protein